MCSRTDSQYWVSSQGEQRSPGRAPRNRLPDLHNKGNPSQDSPCQEKLHPHPISPDIPPYDDPPTSSRPAFYTVSDILRFKVQLVTSAQCSKCQQTKLMPCRCQLRWKRNEGASRQGPFPQKMPKLKFIRHIINFSLDYKAIKSHVLKINVMGNQCCF